MSRAGPVKRVSPTNKAGSPQGFNRGVGETTELFTIANGHSDTWKRREGVSPITFRSLPRFHFFVTRFTSRRFQLSERLEEHATW